jgi:hypothetical protein
MGRGDDPDFRTIMMSILCEADMYAEFRMASLGMIESSRSVRAGCDQVMSSRQRGCC